MLHVEDSVPFLAALEDREADVLVYAGVSYVVEESQDWPRYTRAIALRETWMRWPWQRRERRDSGGDFSDAVVRLIEAQAAGTAADASSTAAVEAASGALSRAFASAEVVGEPWVAEAVSPGVLAQIGRDLVRSGSSMHVIRMGAAMDRSRG